MKKLLMIMVCVLLTASLTPTQEKPSGTAGQGLKIAAQTTPTTIKHVWYVGDQKVFEKALDIKYPSTRTWSAKSVKAGNWRVDVTDDTGTVLASVSFTVK